MPLSEDALQLIVNRELETILLRTDDVLAGMVVDLEQYSHEHQGVKVNFEVMVSKEARPKQYRVTVFAFDDGPAREEFPVTASADIEFE